MANGQLMEANKIVKMVNNDHILNACCIGIDWQFFGHNINPLMELDGIESINYIVSIH